MKRWKNILLIGLTIFFTFSCKEEPVDPIEPVTPVFQMSEGLAVDHITMNGDMDEIGTVMEFLKPGRISQLCARLPADGVYRVTLWEVTTRTVLNSVSIEVEAGIPACVQIVGLHVETGARIMITLLSDDRYVYRHRTEIDGVVFPVETEEVRMTNQSIFVDPVGFEFPVAWLDSRYLAGLADIVFEPESN